MDNKVYYITDKVIDSFTGKYRFLSNFYPVNVKLDGVNYPSVEHAYQAAKTLDEIKRARIRVANSPARAKLLGSKLKLRDDWKNIKIPIMRQLLTQKFNPEVNYNLWVKLMNTHPHDLVEGNYWGDIFWGVCNNKGCNHLGKLLMSIRDYYLNRRYYDTSTSGLLSITQ
jgi:ribA/ribD-fused uncharacterized protein